MANTKSPAGRIVEAARRIVDVVTPGDQSEREGDKRGPIPATAPPGLKRAGDTAKRVASTTARTAKGAASKTVETAKGAAGATVETARRATGRTGRTGRAARSGVPYEQWTRADLYERAQELDISGRSSMNKAELIAALRDRG